MFLFEIMFWKSDGSQTGSVCLSPVCMQTSGATLWPFMCLWKFPRMNLLTTVGLSICVEVLFGSWLMFSLPVPLALPPLFPPLPPRPPLPPPLLPSLPLPIFPGFLNWLVRFVNWEVNWVWAWSRAWMSICWLLAAGLHNLNLCLRDVSVGLNVLARHTCGPYWDDRHKVYLLCSGLFWESEAKLG